MRKLLFLLILLLVGFAVYWFGFRKKSGPRAPKPAPIALQKHSAVFNGQVNEIVQSYLAIKDAFVESDTAAVKKNADDFLIALSKLDSTELKKDTAMVFETVHASLADMKSNVASLLTQTDITEMRRDFSALTEVMYPTFFKGIAYEGPKLYLQNCPMAFGENLQANWISNSAEVVNPYLGKTHPEYKGTMLHCGSVMDTIKAL